MKKNYNIMLIVSLIVLIISMLLLFNAGQDFESKTKNVLESIPNNREISDVEGYGYIFEGTGATLYDIGMLIAIVVFTIVIPFLISASTVFLQIIARLFQIGKEKKWKKVVGMVCSIVSIVLQFAMCTLLTYCMHLKFDVNNIIMIIDIALHIISMILFIYEVKIISKYKIVEENLDIIE